MISKKLSNNPVAVIMKLVGAKWKLLVIQELLKTDMRFSELKQKLGCTSKVLTACLKEMEQDNIVIREAEDTKERKVNYYLTDIGYTLRPVIKSMQIWGKEYTKLQKLIEKSKEKEN